LFLKLKKMNNANVREIARDMIARADSARDSGRFRDAALLYEEALRLTPDNDGIRVQCGNMYKDSCAYEAAETQYKLALARRPNDADLAMQMGHLYKSWGRLGLAAASYARAVELQPEWQDAHAELDRVRRAGVSTSTSPAMTDISFEPAAESEFSKLAASLEISPDVDTLAPELLPSRPQDLLHDHREEIQIRAHGRPARSHWGVLHTLRGVEAIRGFCISATPVTEVQLYLNDQLIHRSAPKGGYPIRHERNNPSLRKYVFNIWFDFADVVRGRHDLEVRTIDARGRSQNTHRTVVVADPLKEQDYPGSDQLFTPSDGDVRPLDVQINSRPSNMRSAKRSLLPDDIKTVLVLRSDQLGDFVVSVPAFFRLREAFPKANLIALLSPANAELGATLNLFDEIIIADFPDDREQRRRIMPLEAQVALRDKLMARHIDLAIDFSENSPSRLLLNLSGARFKYGFRHPLVPDLGLDLEGNSHDPRSRSEMVPHSNKLIGLLEWLQAMARSEPNIVRRDDLDRARLNSFGLGPSDRFAVMHDGARLGFSRWPYYREIAAMILAETDLKIILLTDDTAMRASLPPELSGSSRFLLIDGRMQFDEFDALLHFCSVFVGNDSGPKHLASLRGAPVVSMHMARNSWNEWGQESTGFIMSRKVPCADCQIHHDPEECGRDFVCIRNIKPEEVMQAVRKLL
jgi:ADP-heptose:LPS heptosyltransferase